MSDGHCVRQFLIRRRIRAHRQRERKCDGRWSCFTGKTTKRVGRARGNAFASSGRRTEALQELELLKRSLRAPEQEFLMALVYGALGDKDRAFQWLDSAFRGRALSIVLIKTDPRMDPHADPRYADLLRLMGLPE